MTFFFPVTKSTQEWSQTYACTQMPSLSLSLSRSFTFIFICHVMWEFWVPSPTVRAICARLSLSKHPTNTLSHAFSHPPLQIVEQSIHSTHTAHNLHGNSNISSMCSCIHSPGPYSFLFPVSVLKYWWSLHEHQSSRLHVKHEYVLPIAVSIKGAHLEGVSSY